MRIQNNAAANNAYRQLTANNGSVSKSLENLSSGYRINRAGDDAAGLAISEKMRSQITGLSKAQDNANDGISLVQTAEGALTEVHSMLNRMIELADQSANGTYDNETDRANLQKEVSSLKSEIDRISESTNFNGIKLLDGSMGGAGSTGVTSGSIANLTDENDKAVTVSFSGVNENDTVTFTSTASASGVTKTLIDKDDNTYAYSVNLQQGKEYTQKDLDKIFENSGIKMDASSDGTLTTSAGGFTASDSGLGGVKAAAAKQATTGAAAAGTLKFESTIAGSRDSDTITVNYADAGAEGTTFDKATGNTVLSLNRDKDYTQDEINRMLEDVGSTVKMTSGDIAKTSTANTIADTYTFEANGGVAGKGAAGYGGSLTLQVGDTAQSFNKVSVKVGDMSSKSLGISSVDISTQDGAANAIAKINSAINSVSSTRGDLGAVQNRLEHTINNLGVTEENMTSAESRVRDTDMAKEMMEYTKNNILVQASQAMLAQANQLPQGVLQLLG